MKARILILVLLLIAVVSNAQEQKKASQWSQATKDSIKLALEFDELVKVDSLVDPTSFIDSLGSRVRPLDKTDNYTLILTDAGKVIKVTSATDKVVTIPLNSSVAFPVGTRIDVLRLSTGEVTIAIELGGTLVSELSMVQIGATNTGVSIIKIATDTWLILGRLK